MRGGNGFTLIEILIVLGVGFMVGFLVMNVFVQNNGLLYQQSAKINQGISLNDAMNSITVDIKSAAAVAAGYPPISPTVTSSGSSLVLQIPSIDNNNNIISNTYDYVVISQDTDNQQILREQIYPDPISSRKSGNKVLVNNLALISFTYLNSNGNLVSPPTSSTVNFIINLRQKIGISSEQSSASAQISLRNI